MCNTGVELQNQHHGIGLAFTKSDESLSTKESHPAPHVVELEEGGETLEMVDDEYSDRVRCDHPSAAIDSTFLGESLIQLADESGRGRVVALVSEEHGDALETQGFEREGVIPGFYNGSEDCSVMGYGAQSSRMELANPKEAALTDAVVSRPCVVHDFASSKRSTELATIADAEEIAALIDDTFVDYPTPSSDPDYIRAQLETGTPFRVIRHNGRIVACASADLVKEAATAELTDCATRPSYRGRGYMQRILGDLMLDLQDMNYPTAFTLARARIPGMNRAFQKLGFTYRGRMAKSCRIGDGFEDMNIWSLILPENK